MSANVRERPCRSLSTLREPSRRLQQLNQDGLYAARACEPRPYLPLWAFGAALSLSGSFPHREPRVRILQDRGGKRLRNMALTFATTTDPPHTLTAPEITIMQHVWKSAGGRPSMATEPRRAQPLRPNRPLADELTSVDFDDASSVANAVRAARPASTHVEVNSPQSQSAELPDRYRLNEANVG
jgi:hypothetical protein